MALNWTSEQKQTIDYDLKKDLLISAAAGSGKTAVLTERIVQRLVSGKIEPDQLLVMTFTELAALQMAQKIERSIRARLSENSDLEVEKRVQSLIRQLPLMKISTIHSFCYSVITDYISELVDDAEQPLLEPGFQVLKDEEKKLLLDSAIEDVLSAIYRLDAERKDSVEIAASDNICEAVSPADDEKFLPRSPEQFKSEILPFVLSGPDINLARWLDDFSLLAAAIAPGYDDVPLRQNIATLLEQLRSMADYQDWVQSKLDENYKNCGNWAESAYAGKLFTELRNYLTPALEDLKALQNTEYWERIFDPAEKAKTVVALKDSMAAIADSLPVLERILRNDDWNAVTELGKKLPPITVLKLGSGVQAQEFNAIFNQNISRVLALITSNFQNTRGRHLEKYYDDVYPWFSLSSAEIENSLAGTFGPLARYFELILLVDRRYRELKLAQNKVDFNDFEHYALNLLRQPQIREEYQRRFHEIYVDEYQDTSSIQETVIASFAHDNIFMVGDIKQSIYRFRHANPDLFRGKQERFTDYSELADRDIDNPEGFVIRLNRNFRSLPGIIDFTNKVFASFLTKESGEIDYDHTQALVAGREGKAEQEYNVEFLLAIGPVEEVFASEDPDTEETPTATNHVCLDEQETVINFDSSVLRERGLELKPRTQEVAALLAVDKIRELLREEEYTLNDISILAPNHKTLDTWRQVLTSHGISVAGVPRREFMDSPVLRQLEALVQVLDNSRQDIPLTAVLLSGLLGESVSEEELLMIAVATEDINTVDSSAVVEDENARPVQYGVPYYQRILEFAYGDDECRTRSEDTSLDNDLSDLRTKIRGLLEKIAYWRLLSEDLPVFSLLTRVIEESNYADYLEHRRFAAENLADLESFLAWVELLEQERPLNINTLARYIQDLREKEEKPQEIQPVVSRDAAVQMFTIHGSKGLEFPIVFLTGLDAAYHIGDRYQFASISEEIGVTSYSIDPDGAGTYLNLPQWSQLENEKMAEKAEKWRLLYVAMTRAQDRLYLVDALDKPFGAIANNRDEIEKAIVQARGGDGRLETEILRGIRNDRELLFYIFYLLDQDRGEKLLTSEEGIWHFPHFRAQIIPRSKLLRKVYIETIKAHSREEDIVKLEDITAPDPVKLWRQMGLDPAQYEETIDNYAKILGTDVSGGPLASVPGKITVSDLKRKLSLLAATERETEGLGSEYTMFGDMAYNLKLPAEQNVFKLDREQSDLNINEVTGEQLALEDSRIAAAITDRSSREVKPATTKPMRETIADTSDRNRSFQASPRSKQEKKLSATQLGIALHTVFQFLDFTSLDRAEDIQREYENQLEEMVKKKRLLAEEKTAVKAFATNALNFARSESGLRLRSAEHVYREQPFTLAIPALCLKNNPLQDQRSLHKDQPAFQLPLPAEGQEITLLQGMIDLWLLDDQGILLLDFKSDHVPDNVKAAEELIRERYHIQMEAYAEAIRRATGLKDITKRVRLIRSSRQIDF